MNLFIALMLLLCFPISGHADIGGALVGGMIGASLASSENNKDDISSFDPKPCWVKFKKFEYGTVIVDAKRITTIESKEGLRDTSVICIGRNNCAYIKGTPEDAVLTIKVTCITN